MLGQWTQWKKQWSMNTETKNGSIPGPALMNLKIINGYYTRSFSVCRCKTLNHGIGSTLFQSHEDGVDHVFRRKMK